MIGEAEAGKLSDPAENLSLLFGARLVSPPADKTVADGERFSAAGFDLKVIAIPGHSAGHVVFLVEGQAPCVVFVGDVIFAGSIGRTDFPDGDFAQLAAGIRQKLFPLPDDTILLPGHGPETTVGQDSPHEPLRGRKRRRILTSRRHAVRRFPAAMQPIRAGGTVPPVVDCRSTAIARIP